MGQVATTHEVEVQRLDNLWRCIRINSLEEAVYFFTSHDSELFDVVLHVDPFEQDLVLV